MKLAYLYTRSELTPWKENVNEETLSFLLSQTPTSIHAEIVHFDGFNDDVLHTLRNYDLIFNLSYGYKDAGQVDIAGWLEHYRIPHTASSFKSMSKAQDKSLLPDICHAIGVHTPEIYFETQELEDSKTYIAKPRKGSCHRGISIKSGRRMKKYLNPILKDLIIQPYIKGREFSVAIIPGENGKYYMALPPVEIVPECQDKVYVAGNSFGKTVRVLNPLLSDDIEDELMDYAKILHKVIGLKGMSRTDFRMTDEGVIYVLDVNAMPNMDPEKSLMPLLCSHHGIAIKNLINRIIKNHDYFVSQNTSKKQEPEKLLFV